MSLFIVRINWATSATPPQFIEPTAIEIDGTEYPITSMTCVAEHLYAKKRKWVSFHGDGFYDWHDGSVTIPPTGTVTSMGVEWDLSTWPAFDGEIANKPQQLMLMVIRDEQHWRSKEDALVPDLDVDLKFEWI